MNYAQLLEQLNIPRLHTEFESENDWDMTDFVLSLYWLIFDREKREVQSFKSDRLLANGDTRTGSINDIYSQSSGWIQLLPKF